MYIHPFFSAFFFTASIPLIGVFGLLLNIRVAYQKFLTTFWGWEGSFGIFFVR
jgi:hypothetical protein